jgi:lysophospholipid acyltransferase (LPLAT)-like uncharacterized protein
VLRRFLSSAFGQRVASALLAAYVRLVGRTTRWQVIGGAHAADCVRGGAPAILAFWHGRLGAMPEFRRRCLGDTRVVVLSSTHRDGMVSAATLRRLGLDVIPGSSRRGGSQALRRLVGALRGGQWAAITPDGPRGPRMRAQSGALILARLSGAPILPVAFSTTRGRLLGSWDRMLLAFPFGRGAFAVGPPIVVPQDADEATLARLHGDLESALTAAMMAADAACGRASPQPAPIAR